MEFQPSLQTSSVLSSPWWMSGLQNPHGLNTKFPTRLLYLPKLEGGICKVFDGSYSLTWGASSNSEKQINTQNHQKPRKFPPLYVHLQKQKYREEPPSTAVWLQSSSSSWRFKVLFASGLMLYAAEKSQVGGNMGETSIRWLWLKATGVR